MMFGLRGTAAAAGLRALELDCPKAASAANAPSHTAAANLIRPAMPSICFIIVPILANPSPKVQPINSHCICAQSGQFEVKMAPEQEPDAGTEPAQQQTSSQPARRGRGRSWRGRGRGRRPATSGGPAPGAPAPERAEPHSTEPAAPYEERFIPAQPAPSSQTAPEPEAAVEPPSEGEPPAPPQPEQPAKAPEPAERAQFDEMTEPEMVQEFEPGEELEPGEGSSPAESLSPAENSSPLPLRRGNPSLRFSAAIGARQSRSTARPPGRRPRLSRLTGLTLRSAGPLPRHRLPRGPASPPLLQASKRPSKTSTTSWPPSVKWSTKWKRCSRPWRWLNGKRTPTNTKSSRSAAPSGSSIAPARAGDTATEPLALPQPAFLARIFHSLKAASGFRCCVAQVSNLLYRRLPVGRAFIYGRGARRLETCDAADWKSALRLPAGETCTTLCQLLVFLKEVLVAALPRCEICGLEPVPKALISDLCRSLCRNLCREMAHPTKVSTKAATKAPHTRGFWDRLYLGRLWCITLPSAPM